MEIGSEISQKIRSAIKAKLLELGAYVDDELPDYIMVMVANKRSRAQMKNDLALFLGVNTDPFTGWLHALIGKLQKIQSDSDKAVDKQGDADVLTVVKDKKKVGKLQTVGKVVKRKINKKTGGEGLIMAKKVISSDRKVGETHPDNGGIGTESLGETEDTHLDNGGKLAKRKLNKLGGDGLIMAKKIISNDRILEETHPGNGGNETESGELIKEIGVLPESFQNAKTVRQFSFPQASDDFAEELQTIKREVVNSRTVAVVGITKPTPVFKPIDITAGSVHTSSTRQCSISQGHHHVKPSAGVRKRRASTSVLDHISRAEDEEAYDPYNPSVGAVASLSKFGAHKFNASASLQANRQTVFGASEGMLFGSQTDLHGEYRQPPEKLLKLSETVHLEDIKQALAEVLETTQARNDDVANFSRMLESSLRNLRPQDFSLAKLRIQQILFELESTATQENIVENKQHKNILKQTSYLNKNSKCNSESPYFQTLGAASDLDNTGSLSTSMSGNRRTTFSSPHTPPGSPPGHDANQNSDDQTEHSTASDQQIDNVDNLLERISSNFNENHVARKYDCVSSEQRTHFESSSSQIDRIIFHPKSAMESLKSSRTYDKYNTSECELRTHNHLMVKSREKESASAKPQQGDQHLQSPISLSKIDMESPSSVHSSPLSNTSGLNIRRHVASASRESTLSPHDFQPKPGTSHIHKSKSSSAKSKPPPPILVDSIHNRKRLEPVESASVLRQNWQKDKSPRAADPAKSDNQDSPRHYGPEALKVMAKNLKITVINKRAVKSHQESSSDDSDDDEDLDSSDNEDDEEDEEKTVDKAALKKAISGQSTA